MRAAGSLQHVNALALRNVLTTMLGEPVPRRFQVNPAAFEEGLDRTGMSTIPRVNH